MTVSIQRVDVPAIQLWTDGVLTRQGVLMGDDTERGVWFTSEDGTSWFKGGSLDLDEFAAELEACPETFADEPGIADFYRGLATVAREMGR